MPVPSGYTIDSPEIEQEPLQQLDVQAPDINSSQYRVQSEPMSLLDLKGEALKRRPRGFSHAKPGPYQTQLSPEQETAFQQWLKTAKPASATASGKADPTFSAADNDYDMRGFWQAMQTGDAKQAGNLHFPDTWKTPFHKSFSNESMYATPDAPRWINSHQLADKSGRIVFDERQVLPALKQEAAKHKPVKVPKGYVLDTPGSDQRIGHLTDYLRKHPEPKNFNRQTPPVEPDIGQELKSAFQEASRIHPDSPRDPLDVRAENFLANIGRFGLQAVENPPAVAEQIVASLTPQAVIDASREKYQKEVGSQAEEALKNLPADTPKEVVDAVKSQRDWTPEDIALSKTPNPLAAAYQGLSTEPAETVEQFAAMAGLGALATGGYESFRNYLKSKLPISPTGQVIPPSGGAPPTPIAPVEPATIEGQFQPVAPGGLPTPEPEAPAPEAPAGGGGEPAPETPKPEEERTYATGGALQPEAQPGLQPEAQKTTLVKEQEQALLDRIVQHHETEAQLRSDAAHLPIDGAKALASAIDQVARNAYADANYVKAAEAAHNHIILEQVIAEMEAREAARIAANQPPPVLPEATPDTGSFVQTVLKGMQLPLPFAPPKGEVEWNEGGREFEATAPEGYIGPDGNNTRVASVGKGKEFKTKALAKRAVDKWIAGLVPVQQQQEQAAPTAPLASPAVTPSSPATAPTGDEGSPQKPLWEMTRDELDREHENAKNRDHTDLVSLFGEAGAKKYERLQRQANGMDHKRADAASKQLEEMEGALTPDQQNLLYGVGDTRHSLEDVKAYRDALRGLDAGSPKDLARSLQWAVSQVGDPTWPVESMSPQERIRFAELQEAFRIASQNGWDTNQIIKDAIAYAAKRFRDPEDARFMLEKIVRAIAPGTPPAPLGLMDVAEPGPVWHLKSEKVIGDKMKGPMTAADVLRMLKNNGVTDDELKWTGLDDFLSGHIGENDLAKITPQEIKDHLAQNAIKIEEVTKGAIDSSKVTYKIIPSPTWPEMEVYYDGKLIRTGVDDFDPKESTPEDLQQLAISVVRSDFAAQHGNARYAGYQIPGGDNYREVLLTLPVAPGLVKRIEFRKTDSYQGEPVYGAETRQGLAIISHNPGYPWRVDYGGQGESEGGFPTAEAAMEFVKREARFQFKTPSQVFTTTHFEEPNILVHVRLNDRTTPDGKKLLHIEEIQSDWHQKGRKYRYVDPKKPFAVTGVEGQFATREEAEAAAKENKVPASFIRDERTGEIPAGVLPDAPFKKTWQEMALRRMIRYAAENGYDGVSWTGGNDQAERYNLSKRISKIEYHPEVAGGLLHAYDHDGTLVISESGISEEQLPDYIGKEAAQRLAPKIEEWRHDTDLGYELKEDKTNGKLYFVDGNGDPVRDSSGEIDYYDDAEIAHKYMRWESQKQAAQVPVPELHGLDLDVGGEGMRGFYDKIIPNYLNKFGKKFGARVEAFEVGAKTPFAMEVLKQNLDYAKANFDQLKSELHALEPTTPGDYSEAYVNKQEETRLASTEYYRALDAYKEATTGPNHKFQYLPITPAMRESVVREGVPLFNLEQAGQPRQVQATPLTPRQGPNIVLRETLPGAKEYQEKRYRNRAELLKLHGELIDADMEWAGMLNSQLSGNMTFGQIQKLREEMARVAGQRKGISSRINELEQEYKQLAAAVDPNVGEVRLDEQGNPTLWLNNTAMRLIHRVIRPGDTGPAIMRGGAFTVGEMQEIKNRLANTRPADANEIMIWPSLNRLIDTSIARSRNAGVTVIGKTGHGIKSAIDALREELIHRWQRSRSATGLASSHLSDDAFLRLYNEMPRSAYDHLREVGYSASDAKGEVQLYVIETAAKIMAGKWRKMGLTKQEAAQFLGRYFGEVAQQHGVQSVLEVKHTYGIARDFQREWEKIYGPAETTGKPATPAASPEPATGGPVPGVAAGRDAEAGGATRPDAGRGRRIDLWLDLEREPLEPTEVPEAQRRPIKTFVSPNVFNIEDAKDAQRRLGSMPHQLMRQESEWLLGELGSKVKPRSATGIWEDGAEDTLLHEFPTDTNPDLVTYHNAILAKVGRQKFLLNFFPQEGGNDVLYRLNLSKSAGGAVNISAVLAKHGIKASTITSEYGGNAVFIATTGQEEELTRKAVQNAVDELGGENGGGAELRITRGRSEYVGENDRARAGELFARLIEDREKLHPEWREIRSRLESRPGFVELGRLGDESLHLLESGQIKDPFTRTSHGSRTPNLVEVDPRYHGKGPQRGAESQRKKAWPQYWVNRSYFQLEGIPGEPFYERLPYQYKGTFNRENLYDYHGDPRRLYQQVPHEVMQYGGGAVATYFEKLIKDAGYDGYYVSYGPQAGVVVAFTNTPVEAKLKAGEIKLPPEEPIGLLDLKEEAAARRPMEPGVTKEQVEENSKPNLRWTDIRRYLLPDERKGYEGNPDLQQRLTEAVNIMPDQEEWDAAVKVGAIGKLWYERSARAFDALIDSMPDTFKKRDKDKFINFVAALSPVQTVRLNLMMAINLWDRWNRAGRPQDVKWTDEKNFSGVANEDSELYRLMKGGEEEMLAGGEEKGNLFAGTEAPARKRKTRGVDLESRLSNAIRALQDQPLSGPKVSAFAPNLGENVEKSTNDTWMAIFANLDPNVINQKANYDAVSAMVRIAAEKNGIPPRQAQAAIWSFIKTLAEMSGWGKNRWIPPQEVLNQKWLTPEMVDLHSADFADLLRNDWGIRAKIAQIGGDLNVLDRKLKRRVPAKPEADEGAINEFAERLSGAASRLEATRQNERIRKHAAYKSDRPSLYRVDEYGEVYGPEAVREPLRFDLTALKEEAEKRKPAGKLP